MKTCFVLFAWLVVTLGAFGEMREWKTADGSKSIEAEYVRSGDGKVTILRKDRRSFTIDLEKLSEADREWVKAKEAEMAKGEATKEVDESFATLITGDWERHEGHGLKYRIYGERKLNRSKGGGYPLVIYLHGRGGDVMTPNAPGQARSFSDESNYRKRPCFVIAPQNPNQAGWQGADGASVLKIVQELIAKLPIDEKRIYLTGYSMGGYGTFHLLAQEPELFAAGVPVAGGGQPRTAAAFKAVPVWVFHGAKDPTVNVSQSQKMVEALKAAEGTVKYTEYPDGDHGIAGKVYADEEMHEWLFEQKKAQGGKDSE